MKRVVGLIAFCSMVLNVSIISNLEAKPSNVKTEKKVKRNTKIKEKKSKTVRKNQRKNKKASNTVKKKKSKSKVVANSSKINKKKDLVIIDEPIIDGSKINESSVVVDKNIKLAINTEDTKLNEKPNAIDMFSASNEDVLTRTDNPHKKDTKLLAKLDKSEEIIKEKMQQVNHNRKVYDLIRPPKKSLKNDIQITKFRDELDYYRKIYSSNLEKA